MTQVTNNDRLIIPLYHGTTTLFLDSIVQHGLGGTNPIENWNVLRLSIETLQLSEVYLDKSARLTPEFESFRRMTKQEPGTFNWQHGDTYVSPCKETAIRYATSARFGSELLSHTLYYLERLSWQDVPEVRENLQERYPEVLNLLNLSSAPILVEVNDIRIAALSGEDGGDALENLERIDEAMQKFPEIYGTLIQQYNFRLRHAISVDSLRVWLISVVDWHSVFPNVTLYEVTAD